MVFLTVEREKCDSERIHTHMATENRLENKQAKQCRDWYDSISSLQRGLELGLHTK